MPDQDNLNFSQQAHIFHPNYVRPVTVIGAGSVGSLVVTMLPKIGVTTLTVIDGDAVESHNIPMSAYGINDLSTPKVNAIRRIVEEQSGLTINAIPQMYTGGALQAGAIVACVDSMEARQLIWTKVRMNPAINVLIDTRVANELVSVFAIDPCDEEDIDYYEPFLAYSSRQAVRPLCGTHGIIYVSTIVASAVCVNLTNWWKKGTKKRHFMTLVGELETIEP